MGKIKKSILAAKRASKKSQQTKSVANNPFEVRVNKKKYDILGRKMKHERGLPGVSRSNAIKKREKTLLVEYKQKNKANVFMDKRFGENDNEMTLEDKLLKRFAIEKQKHHEKTGIYNLEEEELTHLGQSLGDINKFDDVRLSDIEDDENDNMVESHFGGFLKKKRQTVDTDYDKEAKPKTRKEIMEEVVAKAKLKKHERQKAKEENTNLTDLLDQDFMDIRNILVKKEANSKQEKNSNVDDYDITVRELAYEVKGKATNRLKTDIELAKEEQEKLKKLEEDRIRRMTGITVSNKPVHFSADDLGDSFTLPEDTRTMLSYDDGKVNLPDGQERLEYEWLNGKEKEVDDQESGSDNEFSDEDEGSGEGDSSEESEQDNGSDLDSDPGSEDEDIKQSRDKIQPTDKSDLKKKKKTKEKIEKELPFTFVVPKSYEDFKKLINKWPVKDHITIIERIKACNHPKISPENKVKMEGLFSILLQYFGEMIEDELSALSTVDKLVRLLFDIAQFSPITSCQVMQNLIKKEHNDYTESQGKGLKSSFPGLKTIVYLQIVSLLFPTSDLMHCVCTSSMVFMSQILSQVKVSSVSHVIRGLFLCSIYLEYVSFSQRFVPEIINFLSGVLYLACKNFPGELHVVPPFKTTGKYSELLKITENKREIIPIKMNVRAVFSDFEDSNSVTSKVSAVHTALLLTNKCIKLYQKLPAFKEIFLPIKTQLQRLPADLYHDNVKSLKALLVEEIESIEKRPRKHLTLFTRKPEALKTFTPKFQEHYEIKSKKTKQGNKNTNEKEKLKYKLKREFKGAVREIRKDTQFLSRQKLKEQLERDAERMRKVKEIEHLLCNEQAEVNELNRIKKRKR